jgi:hypoxanthine-DNA glycosylase
MIETHPFGVFAPAKARYLILGSFAGRQAVPGTPYTDEGYDWYYGTRRNQFWPILEEVYGIALRNKADKQALFNRLGIAIADIILQGERIDGNNLDRNLRVIAYNTKAIGEVIELHPIERIFFTSLFVLGEYKKAFKAMVNAHPGIELVVLPSPSPRNARWSRVEKVRRYKELFPIDDGGAFDR